MQQLKDLSSAQNQYLQKLLSSKTTHTLMPHQLAVILGVSLKQAEDILWELDRRGVVRVKEAYYHHCSETPIMLKEVDDEYEFPFQCPICEEWIDDFDEMDSDQIARILKNE